MAMSLMQACERCWRRKQKCARDFPCLQCRTASTTCVRRHLGTTIEPTEGGVSALSYIEALKERIRVLQMSLEEGENHAPIAQIATPSTQLNQQSPFVLSTGSQTPRNELHDAMHEASYLSLSAMAERTDKQHSTVSGLSFMTLFHAAIAIEGADPTKSTGSTDALNKSSLGTLALTYPNDIATLGDSESAFCAYLEYLRHSCPYMPNSVLRSNFKTVMNAHERGTINEAVIENPDMCVLAYIGTATGILLSPHHKTNESAAKEWFIRGKNLLPCVFDRADELSMVQCLIAFTIYAMFTTDGGSVWHLLGLALTRCIASGMHTPRISDTRSEDRCKRRNAQALWSLFVLDTEISTALDRPFCLDDVDVMVSSPSSPALHEDEGSLGRLVQHAQLLRSFRRDRSTNLLSSFISLRHWQETCGVRMTFLQLNESRLYTHGFVELIKCLLSRRDPNGNLILKDAMKAFATHLDLVEEFLLTPISAPPSLDIVHIFSIGVIICQLARTDEQIRISKTHQAINILTLYSTRYGPARYLRDVLTECLMISTGSNAPRLRLHEAISRARPSISIRLQGILLERMVA